jgi:hypothetical protein
MQPNPTEPKSTPAATGKIFWKVITSPRDSGTPPPFNSILERTGLEDIAR